MAIARAVYADADLYLLDDCLSAVDSQVAHHIFWECIKAPSLLGPKAVVLVTHNLQLLRDCDSVALLDGQAVPFVGSPGGFGELDHDLARTLREAKLKGSSGGSSGSLENLAEALERRSNSGKGSCERPLLAAAKGAPPPEAKEGGVGRKAGATAAAKAVAKAAAKEGKEGKEKDGRLIEKEAMARGSVSLETYHLYVGAGGSWRVVLGVVGGLAA